MVCFAKEGYPGFLEDLPFSPLYKCIYIFQMILKFFDIFLKMKDLTDSEGFMVCFNDIIRIEVYCNSEKFVFHL